MRRPSIRALLLGANAALVVLPILAIAGLRVYDVYLLRQTERELIVESVMVAEVFRDAYQRELSGTQLAEYRPTDQRAAHYVRLEPVLDLGLHVLPAQPSDLPVAPEVDSPARRAGLSIEPLLRRAQTFNLSAVRVLDARGCVIATTRSEAGACMHMLPEVRDALAGRYAAVARERVSDEPPPPFGDIRRRGKERVFSALPVFSDGRVIAVVRASRTGLDAVSTLWANRRGLVLSAGAVALFGLIVSLGFSAAIARPLRRLTRTAQSVAQGGSSAQLAAPGFAPAEVATLSEVLATMTDRLQERARYVAEFASNASHELKTPITAIRGAAELLQHEGASMDAAQRERFSANILEDAERMERLVTRMLELARIENAAPELERAESLAIEAFVRGQLERYGSAVQLEVADPPRVLSIPESHARSVLVNLVDNAVRHGAGKPVRVLLASEAGRLRLDVIDQGPGVSPANRERLFQRFFTTERDRGGTGLGLAIVKAVAEARGGRVSARVTPEGSTFSVVL
ncbi:MAG TPA: ATP-binding protein [Polyangiales bacterium]|nr:ATP-binding protein [Polyangiales bacterium]